MNAKPCLGYPSRTLAVQALEAQGWSRRQIAEKIGIDVKTVSALSYEGRRPQKERPIGGSLGAGDQANTITPEAAVKALIPMHAREPFREHAIRRDVSQATLIRMLMDKVLEDNLVDAILDDAGERS